MSDPRVDAVFDDAIEWAEEMRLLRRIVLEHAVDEAYKWRQPVYVAHQGNEIRR